MRTSAPKFTNRLSDEKSPYLLQHAHNPVDWFPWGDEAFAKAKAEDKPVLLSVGYSTCHWCHVMEHESFENEEIAALMNATVVAIKVDREERPDIDSLYMQTVMMMTGQGGWPLNVFLTPDRRPFYGGTYFPPHSHHGRPGFPQVLQSIDDAWRNRRAQIEASADKLTGLLLEMQPAGETGADGQNVLVELEIGPIHAGREQFARAFDSEHGGFGRAPKFPRPSTLDFLLRAARRQRQQGDTDGAEQTLAMVEKTLDEMARGGMHDQLGGGFHRYSVDEHWLVPHFEKMLYDQALLVRAYIEAWQLTGKPDYAAVARDVCDCVLRDLTDSAGGFFSGEDADSEGVEGKFWVFSLEEFRAVACPEDAASADLFARWFGLTEAGNYEHGLNILHQPLPLGEFLRVEKLEAAEFLTRLDKIRQKLFAHREARIRPHRDDKVLTGWNGLMISALARAGAALDEPRYLAAAEKAAAFIDANMIAKKRLLHTWREGEAKIGAFLEDVAALGQARLDLYEATFDTDHLRRAIELATELISHFWDDAAGGFYDSADDAEKLLTRRKESYDGAQPAGNSLAALFLLRLGRLTGRDDWFEWGRNTLAAFASVCGRDPTSHPELLKGLDFYLGPQREVVIAGDPAAPETRALLRAYRDSFQPASVLALRPKDPATLAEIVALIPFIAKQVPPSPGAWVFVCENFSCKAPVNDLQAFKDLLGD